METVARCDITARDAASASVSVKPLDILLRRRNISQPCFSDLTTLPHYKKKFSGD